MAEIILGVLFLLGGLAWTLLVFMAAMMNPTPGHGQSQYPQLYVWIGPFVAVLGVALLIWG